ncbi:MAG: DoxX family protein [Cyclobacteriaceae bacterium]|nr:DoxX family protein [Cyclobacteriaceae bacterium]
MKLTLSQREPWIAGTFPKWLCILRMALGLFLLYKGLFYLFHVGDYQALPGSGMDPMIDTLYFHLVIFIHLAGGVFITLGYHTRLMVLAQVPIVLGALYFIDSPSRLIVWEPNVEYTASLLCLLLLLTFLIYGSGTFSVDQLRKEKLS